MDCCDRHFLQHLEPHAHSLLVTPPPLAARTDWCDRHFLHGKGLRKAKEVRQQLLDIMTQVRGVEQGGERWA